MLTLSLSAGLLAIGVGTAGIGTQITEASSTPKTNVVYAATTEKSYDKYDAAVKALHTAYQTRSNSDIKSAQTTIDSMDDKDDISRMDKSLENLKGFIKEVNTTSIAVERAESSSSKDEVAIAKTAVNNLDKDVYLLNDHNDFTKRLQNVDNKIKAAEDAARKAEEARQAEEARKAEEARQAEEARVAEENRKAEEAKAAEAAAAQAKAQTATQTVQAQPTSTSTAGLNLSQTSGTVDIQALANYMVTNTANAAGYSASEWAYIITHESNGQANIANASSGAYGCFQLLGHGEYAGMTLAEQIAMASKLPAGSWVVYN